MDIKKEVVRVCKDNKVTQKMLGKHLRLSRTQVGNIMRGDSIMTVTFLEGVAAATGKQLIVVFVN